MISLKYAVLFFTLGLIAPIAYAAAPTPLAFTLTLDEVSGWQFPDRQVPGEAPPAGASPSALPIRTTADLEFVGEDLVRMTFGEPLTIRVLVDGRPRTYTYRQFDVRPSKVEHGLWSELHAQPATLAIVHPGLGPNRVTIAEVVAAGKDNMELEQLAKRNPATPSVLLAEKLIFSIGRIPYPAFRSQEPVDLTDSATVTLTRVLSFNGGGSSASIVKTPIALSLEEYLDSPTIEPAHLDALSGFMSIDDRLRRIMWRNAGHAQSSFEEGNKMVVNLSCGAQLRTK